MKTIKAAAKKTAKKTKAKKPTGKNKIQLGKDIWPLETDVLFRPDRLKYVRKMMEPEGCVFCHAGQNKIKFESLCVHKSNHSMVVINKFPYNSGHLLVLPLRHCANLLDLSDDEYSDLHELLRMSVNAIQDLYNPGGINIGMNHGSVAGAGIPDHLHYHLVPRWSGDLNFFPLIAQTKVVIESLAQTYEKYQLYFKKRGG